MSNQKSDDSCGIYLPAANGKVHDGFLTEFVVFQFAGYASLVHDDDAVADSQDFLHVA